MTLNFPGRVGHAEELVFGEVGLDDATPLDVQLLAPGGAKAVDDGTFNLVFSAAEVDDLRADIGHADDAIHAEFAGFGDGDLGHLSNVAAVTKVKRDALTLTAREFFAPAGFFGDEFDHGFHARGVIGRATFSGAWKGAVITQDFESHGERIAAGGVGELVDEALVDEGEHATAGRAPRAHGNAVLDHAAKAKVIRDKSAGEFIRTESPGEEDSVIAPGGNFARRIDAACEEMKTARAEMIVAEVVFARPSEFDGDAGLLGNGGGLNHEIGAEAAPETAAGAEDVDGDVGFGNAEDLADHVSTGAGILRGCPNLGVVRGHASRAVLRLEIGVRDEGIGISSLHGFARGSKSSVDIAVFAHDVTRAFGGKRLSLLGEVIPAVIGAGAFFPDDLELASSGERGPGGIGDNGDAGHKSTQVARAFENEGIFHSRESFDPVDVGGDHFAAEDRAFFKHGVGHAG